MEDLGQGIGGALCSALATGDTAMANVLDDAEDVVAVDLGNRLVAPAIGKAAGDHLQVLVDPERPADVDPASLLGLGVSHVVGGRLAEGAGGEVLAGMALAALGGDGVGGDVLAHGPLAMRLAASRRAAGSVRS